MVAKADTARRGNLPFEVQALSGIELHHVKFKEESEYLLIDLGNTAGRRQDFGDGNERGGERSAGFVIIKRQR